LLVEELRAAGWVDASAGTYRLIPARNYRERHDISADQTVDAVDSLLKSSGAIVLSLPVGPASDAPQELVFWERPKVYRLFVYGPAGYGLCEFVGQ